MKKEDVLQHKKWAMDDLQREIDNIKRLEKGKYYESRIGGSIQLLTVNRFNQQSVNFTVLATNSVPSWGDYKTQSYQYNYTILENLKEVPPENFPLYIGMKYVSTKLTKLIKKGKPHGKSNG